MAVVEVAGGSRGRYGWRRMGNSRSRADDKRSRRGEHELLDAEPRSIAAYCGLAALQGVLVMLPRPAASGAWNRAARSPGWALVLPGALMVGTFGVLGGARLAQPGSRCSPRSQRPFSLGWR